MRPSMYVTLAKALSKTVKLATACQALSVDLQEIKRRAVASTKIKVQCRLVSDREALVALLVWEGEVLQSHALYATGNHLELVESMVPKFRGGE